MKIAVTRRRFSRLFRNESQTPFLPELSRTLTPDAPLREHVRYVGAAPRGSGDDRGGATRWRADGIIGEGE